MTAAEVQALMARWLDDPRDRDAADRLLTQLALDPRGVAELLMRDAAVAR